MLHAKNIWNWNILTYEIPNSYVKSTGSKFHMWNLGTRNKYFTHKVVDSRMKIIFTYEIFILRMELKQFTYRHLFSYVKLHVKFLLGYNKAFEDHHLIKEVSNWDRYSLLRDLFQ